MTADPFAKYDHGCVDPHVYGARITTGLTAGVQAKRYFTDEAYGPWREVVRTAGPLAHSGKYVVYFTDGTVATVTKRTRWETRVPLTPEQQKERPPCACTPTR